MKTNELIGPALDWAVAKCEGLDIEFEDPRDPWLTLDGIAHQPLHSYTPSTDWSQGGPIIERENISTIRIKDESIPDNKGFWQGKYEPQWGAVLKDKHTLDENHSPQGDHWGVSYHVDQDAILGPTPLIAAMRCYVASKLGDDVTLPPELEQTA